MPATISGVGHWVPATRVTSQEVEKRVNQESSPFQLQSGLVKLATGVAERRYAQPPLSSADLAANAAIQALRDSEIDPAEVELLIFASASSAMLEPATANLVQDLVRCTRARVFDLKNACNSFVDALDIAQTLVEARRYRRVLVAAGEVCSPTIKWQIGDRAEMTRRLAGLTLGDAGGACVVDWSEDAKHCLLAGEFLSDGSLWRLSVVMSGGTMLRHDLSRLHLDCDSIALIRASYELVPGAIRKVLEHVGWTTDDVSIVVPHQVSDAAIDGICDSVGIDPGRCTRTLRQYGNTAAASIPLGLSLAKQSGRLQRGDRVLVVGASAGFSVGVIPLVWS